jgi:hypothetical protein
MVADGTVDPGVRRRVENRVNKAHPPGKRGPAESIPRFPPTS